MDGRCLQQVLSMAVTRDDPYGPFHFLVTISPESGGACRGGFLECSGLNAEITPVDYREGTDPSHRKIPRMNKAGEVTLKRGLIGAQDFWQWVDQVRNGNRMARATVLIQLRSEDRAAVVATWKLTCARPCKWIGATFEAKAGSDVAMEELVLACDDITYA